MEGIRLEGGLVRKREGGPVTGDERLEEVKGEVLEDGGSEGGRERSGGVGGGGKEGGGDGEEERGWTVGFDFLHHLLPVEALSGGGRLRVNGTEGGEQSGQRRRLSRDRVSGAVGAHHGGQRGRRGWNGGDERKKGLRSGHLDDGPMVCCTEVTSRGWIILRSVDRRRWMESR